MKKSTRIALSIMLVCVSVFVVFGLTACKDVDFKVNFVVEGEVYATIKTSGNEVIKMPENPTKAGYNFDGWYWDEDDWKKPFTANSLLDAPLSSDMSVYAKFVSNEIPPTQASVVAGLKNIPNIVDVEAATEYNDPNGQLNKAGGYIADIFFSVDVINQRLISGTTLVEKGTNAGGSIEIYQTAKEAETRNAYLASFDGGIFASGSHKVIGTCVVRTALELTASLQNILENNIEKMLTGSTDAYVSMDSYLFTVAKEIAEKDYLSEYETATKLIELGYPLEKAEQIAKNCGVNWNNIAKGLAEGYADYYAMVSPLMIAELLADHEFSADSISYAIQNADIDWEFYATRHAEEFVTITESRREYLTPNAVLVYLCWEKGYIYDWGEYVFDKSEYCQIALDNLTVNWNQKALKYIDYIEAEGPLAQKNSYISALTGMQFTQSQAEYAVANCNINWNSRALLCLKHFVEDLSATTPNHSQCIAKLLEWGFSATEANYAIANYDGLIFPDKLDYVITLDPNEGTVSKTTVEVKFGKYYSLPTPTRTGYEFDGWYNGSTQVSNGTWYTPNDLKLVAHWSIENYTITYNLDGGVNNSLNLPTYTINSTVTLQEPTKQGHTFAGWTYSGQTTPVKNVTIARGTTGAKTYTANWTPNTYTITYDANGGTYSKVTETVIYGQYFKPSDATRTGYNFNNWHYDTGKGYHEEYCSDYYNIASDVTLVAWWNAETYKITYDANGGSISSTTQSVFYDSPYTLRTPTRSGYTFKGWKNGTDDFTSGKWTLTFDVTLVAQWETNTYSITYDANGGEVSKTSDSIQFDSDLTLPTPERVGYTFIGWYNGSTKYDSGTWKTANHITLTAKWKANTNTPYVVNHYQQNLYDDEYTLVETDNKTGTSDAPLTPARNSYAGFTAPSGQTVSINPDGTLVVNYYYTRNSYTITFFENGGNDVASITAKYQEPITLPTPVKEDMTFGGWYLSSWFYEKANFETMPSNGYQLFARWTEETDPKLFNYDFVTGGITITGYRGELETMWIPTHIYGQPVIAISANAFKSNKTIAKVVVPNTVTTIGEGAFYGCSSLADITLPFVGNSESATENYKQVFGYIFGYTSSTSYGSIPDWESSTYSTVAQALQGNALYRYYVPISLANVSITKQTAIPNNAFRNCDLIETINIPTSTASIGEYAFYNCKSLSKLNGTEIGAFNIPQSVTRIEKHVFQNCLKAANVTLSNSVTTIGEYAFAGCAAIAQFNSGTVNELNVPTSCTSIGTYAFKGLAIITNLNIPDSVETIENGAFMGCSALVDITLPFVGNSEGATENYKQVFGYIFGYTSSTSYGSIPDWESSTYSTVAQALQGNALYRYYVPISLANVSITKQTAIPNNAFRNCDLIETINIPTSTASIGEYAFYNCKSLSKLNGTEIGAFNIPQSVTRIEKHVFQNCLKAANVTLSNSVTTIGEYAFAGCAAIAQFNSGTVNELNVPTSCTSIGTYAFKGLAIITNLNIPDSVETIENGAFMGCSALVDITLPFVGNSEGATENYKQVFGYIFGYTENSYSTSTIYNNLTSAGSTAQALIIYTSGTSYCMSYYIPSSIRNVTITKQTAIPTNAFRNCDLIETINIPTNTTSIGNYAFYNTKKLTSLNIPNSISIGIDSFVNSGLVTSKTGVVYIGSVLYKYNGTMPSGYTLNVKAGTTAIQANALSGCSGLAKVILPDSLISIGQNAFKNCSSLTDIEIPSSVTSIGSNAFSGCSKLTTISVPFIGTSVDSTAAFSTIFSTIPTTLTHVVITGDVTVNANAFKNCSKIQSIVFEGDVASIGNYAFYGCSALTSLTMPNTVTSIGDYAFSGCSVLPQFDISDMTALTAIGTYAFNGCKKLTEIVVPANVITIAEYAFNGCTSLANITLSNKTEKIGNYAFNGCSVLTTLVLESDVLDTIGAYAFQNCSALTTIYIPSTVTYIGEYAFNGCTNLTINCEASAMPADWDYNWNPGNCSVVWGQCKD